MTSGGLQSICFLNGGSLSCLAPRLVSSDVSGHMRIPMSGVGSRRDLRTCSGSPNPGNRSSVGDGESQPHVSRNTSGTFNQAWVVTLTSTKLSVTRGESEN